VKVKFLPSTIPDLKWFKSYYAFKFPEGARKASLSFLKAQKLLEKHPMIGRTSKSEGNREYFIPRTPFKFVYRVSKDKVEILRVLDTRADDPEFWLNEEP
jgi:plasmid stabilization system protein ParE